MAGAAGAEAVAGPVDRQEVAEAAAAAVGAVVHPAAVEGAEGVVGRVARRAAVGAAVDRVDHLVAVEVAAAAAAAVLWLHLQHYPLTSLNLEALIAREPLTRCAEWKVAPNFGMSGDKPRQDPTQCLKFKM